MASMRHSGDLAPPPPRLSHAQQQSTPTTPTSSFQPWIDEQQRIGLEKQLELRRLAEYNIQLERQIQMQKTLNEKAAADALLAQCLAQKKHEEILHQTQLRKTLDDELLSASRTNHELQKRTQETKDSTKSLEGTLHTLRLAEQDLRHQVEASEQMHYYLNASLEAQRRKLELQEDWGRHYQRERAARRRSRSRRRNERRMEEALHVVRESKRGDWLYETAALVDFVTPSYRRRSEFAKTIGTEDFPGFVVDQCLDGLARKPHEKLRAEALLLALTSDLDHTLSLRAEMRDLRAAVQEP